MHRQRLLGVLLALGLGVVAGCASPENGDGTRLTRENFERIRPEMTCSQVVAILGEPSKKTVIGAANDCHWLWRDGDRSVEVVFDNQGRVLTRGRRPIKYGNNLD